MNIKSTPYWMRQTMADVGRHEGFRQYAYPDPLSPLFKANRKEKWGFVPASVILAKLGQKPDNGKPWTVGIGFTNGVTHLSTMSLEAANRKLEQELLNHFWVLDKACPGWLRMPDVVKTVLANLAFNMGGNFLQFKNTIKLLNAGEYSKAADNLRASLWYKQVGGRAVELTARLKTMKIDPKYLVN